LATDNEEEEAGQMIEDERSSENMAAFARKLS
jgi:hypothetical protein